jgi:TM2 domain-containing membrane protein YozV/Tfp pilus assembly protein PilE
MEGQSPKSKTTTLLLCLFFGGLGVHRFYIGRNGTAILMLLTLGGAGVWTLIDFILAATGKLRDGDGNLVNQRANVPLVVGLCVVYFVGIFIFVGMIAAILIPQYHKYAVMAQEGLIDASLQTLDFDQENYFAVNNRYSADLTDLEYINDNVITIDSISLSTDYSKNTPCYDVSFTLNMSGSPYKYQKCRGTGFKRLE